VVAPSPARPSKVDRSAAYAARWVAKHVVASGAASRCEVQVAYAIGVARPVSVLVETFGTETVAPERIAGVVPSCRPAARGHHPGPRPAPSHHRRTAAYGHFGRSDKDFTWRPPLGWTTAPGPRALSQADAASAASVAEQREPDGGTVGDREVVRVVCDVAGLSRRFDYLVPEKWRGQLRVGSRVRVALQGRRVGAWVVGLDPEPPSGIALSS